MPLFLLAAGVALSLLLSGIVYGQTTTPRDESQEGQDVSGAETIPAPFVLEIGNDGSVLIRGVITEVNDDSLTIESWGGEWNLEVDDEITVVSEGEVVVNEIPEMSVGDFVGAEGTMDDTDATTVQTTFVRNWTTDPYPAFSGTFNNPLTDTAENAPGSQNETQNRTTDTNTQDQATDTESSNATSNMAVPRQTDDRESATGGANITGWTGTVDEVNGDTFTYTDDHDRTYTVDISNAALMTDDNEMATADDIDAGASVTIDGTIDQGLITASKVTIESIWPF